MYVTTEKKHGSTHLEPQKIKGEMCIKHLEKITCKTYCDTIKVGKQIGMNWNEGRRRVWNMNLRPERKNKKWIGVEYYNNTRSPFDLGRELT